jgi:hypothetical protein
MFYEDAEEAFFFDNVDDCADKIKMVLRMPKENADTIREAARRRSLTSGYGYEHRAQQALKELRELVGKEVAQNS